MRNEQPEEALLQREQQTLIKTLLAKLTPEDRSVVIMRYWYNLSYEEISEATGSTVSAVKSRLHRARGSLAALLTPAIPQSPGHLDPIYAGVGGLRQ